MVLFLSLALVCHTFPSFAQTKGAIDYNTAKHRYEFYDGSAWKPFLLTLSSFPCPKESEMEYDTLLKAYKYCNGIYWVHILGIITLELCSKGGMMDFTGSRYRYCNGLTWVAMN